MINTVCHGLFLHIIISSSSSSNIILVIIIIIIIISQFLLKMEDEHKLIMSQFF